MKKIEAVIFDLDGVIANTVEHYYFAGKRLADEIGIPFDRDLNQRLQGLNRFKQVEIMLGDQLSDYTEDQIRSLGNQKSDYYREKIAFFSKKDVLPGMIDFLQELKQQQIKTAIASSSSNAIEVINKLEVVNYIDYIVDINQIKNGKPDPEIFLTAAKGLHVEPRNSVALEDGEAGLKGILQTEMFSVGIGSHYEMTKADWQVDSTAEISLSKLQEKWSSKKECSKNYTQKIK